jgi:hypothetical protein
MDLVHGIVSDLRAAVHVSGYSSHGQGGGGGGVSTAHISDFQLGSRAVRIKCSQPAMIRDGDELVAAGSSRADGLFEAKAYRNLTRSVRSEEPHRWVRILWPTVACAFPICLLVVAANPAIADMDRYFFAGFTFFVSALALLGIQQNAERSEALRRLEAWDLAPNGQAQLTNPSR